MKIKDLEIEIPMLQGFNECTVKVLDGSVIDVLIYVDEMTSNSELDLKSSQVIRYLKDRKINREVPSVVNVTFISKNSDEELRFISNVVSDDYDITDEDPQSSISEDCEEGIDIKFWDKGYSDSDLEGYSIIQWPESQDIRGDDPNVYLINDDEGLDLYGSSAYVVKNKNN